MNGTFRIRGMWYWVWFD